MPPLSGRSPQKVREATSCLNNGNKDVRGHFSPFPPLSDVHRQRPSWERSSESVTSHSSLLGAAAMNTFLLSALCLLGAWATLTGGVIVKDGDFSFSLESVKKLKDLQEIQEPRIPRNPVGPIASNLCSLPTFPEELKPLCKEPNAQEILDRLGAIAADPSTCEICAYAACAGC
uniref:Guanylin n=2 Tax=Capra hircus TaxID=9925 RepID=A0A8C2NI03_CAPHI